MKGRLELWNYTFWAKRRVADCSYAGFPFFFFPQVVKREERSMEGGLLERERRK